MNTDIKNKPAILAPAGNKACFLAALAAGADAVYCGLKNFSARMEAKNFSLKELAELTHLAHEKNTQVYVTLNSLVKPQETELLGKIMDQLSTWVKPDALIIQDIGLIEIARQCGFKGDLHLSTLANVTFPEALTWIKGFSSSVNRVVLPRELNIDEIKAMALACPDNLDLEIFIHGALCYSVSGRCYWSSYMGGKSGLRGRCVQPCRRLYRQNSGTKRLFSCQDLSLDVLVKVLLNIPQIKVWKIEGRKKGPHYVFYAVQAYKMLRDHGHDPQMKKNALELLSWALGRTGTHYNFLPQRPQNPVRADGQTNSGLLMGVVKGGRQAPYIVPREELLPEDVLRIGYEDEPWHAIQRVSKYVPKKGRLHLKLGKKPFSKNAPVFLTDRREKALNDMILNLENQLPDFKNINPSDFYFKPFKCFSQNIQPATIQLHRQPVKSQYSKTGPRKAQAFWLSDHMVQNMSKALGDKIWWWLPPVIWPDEESVWKSLVQNALNKGARQFVLNAPWQQAFFENPEKLNLWAGPFCNIANPAAIAVLSRMGFKGVIVSPELGQADYIQLPRQSCLPLGIVISGNWPLGISRILPENLKTDQAFSSPKGEDAWVKVYGQNVWVYPTWQIDIEAKKLELQEAGYKFFIQIQEPIPPNIKMKIRPGFWNWKIDLA